MAADTLATEHVPAWGDVNLGDDDRIKTWQVPDVIGYQPLDTLPLDCQANVGKNAYDIRAFAVQFSDCDSTWNVCMSVNNTVSLDDAIDMLRIVPVSARRYMSGLVSVLYYGSGNGDGMQEGKSITVQAATSALNILHLATLVATGYELTKRKDWIAAVDRDTCVVDKFAATGYGNAFRRALILRWDQLDKGRMLGPPDGGSLDCMSNQLAYVASLAPFSDAADRKWHGSTCDTKSDALSLFEVQESRDPLHKEGPDPTTAKRSDLTFTSPARDTRAESDPITASWPLLDGSDQGPISISSIPPEPAANSSQRPPEKSASRPATEPAQSPTPHPGSDAGDTYSTAAFSVVSGTFLARTSGAAHVASRQHFMHWLLLFILPSLLLFYGLPG